MCNTSKNYSLLAYWPVSFVLSFSWWTRSEYYFATMLSLSTKPIVVQKEGNTTHLMKIVTIQQTTFITTHRMIYLCGWNILINSVSPVKMMPSHLQVNDFFQLISSEGNKKIYYIDWLIGVWILHSVAKVISFSQLCRLLSPARTLSQAAKEVVVLKCVQQYAVLVQGSWVVKR